ncbi:hypothetical protein AAOE16_03005 [Ekhidna sp. MALMAid0563]|uniref:hypothetical protein n=1 Tax=Ekhidna sp. MALMAid0563 TaxID=3143937 RepID=UPI0032DFC133
MKALQNSMLILFLGISISTLAQPPGGGRGGRPGGGPEQMIEREKQTLYSKVEDLTDDQKLLLDGIYEEFLVIFQESMEEMRQSNDRESRREKMEALRKEKDELIADVLNEDQFKIYESISRTRRERRDDDDGKN